MSTVVESSKRRALGKGLESLLPGRTAAAAPPQTAATPADDSGKPREIAVEAIERNPYQTRTRFDEQQLSELADSIAATGVVQPILVRPVANGRFQLIAGERRWLASKQAGKATSSGRDSGGFGRAGDGDDHRRKPAAGGPEPD